MSNSWKIYHQLPPSVSLSYSKYISGRTGLIWYCESFHCWVFLWFFCEKGIFNLWRHKHFIRIFKSLNLVARTFFYQTSHLAFGFMSDPTGHWNTSENSLVLDRTPMTLNLAGEWESSRIWSWLAWGVDVEHQTWKNYSEHSIYNLQMTTKKYCISI